MGDYYNREGEPITQAEWITLSGRETYRRIALTESERFRVSTVWLGLDHGFYRGTLEIFETMVFPGGDGFVDEYCDRTATVAAAQAAHDQAVMWAQEHM